MNIRTLPTALEIRFWSFAISLMSQSRVAQALILKAYDCLTSARFFSFLRWGLLCSGAGFLLGLLLGMLGL